MPTGAPSGARTQNTMQEGLTGLLQNVAYLQTLPDADLEYLVNLQALLVGKLRQPMQDAMAAAQGGVPPLGSASPMPPMGGPMDMGGMPPGVPGPPPGPVPPGLRNGIGLPPVDELRRLVTGANQ